MNRSTLWRFGAVLVPALAALALAVPAASAGTTPLSVTLSASGTGASAVWQGGSIVLTPGTPSSSTYAQMRVNLPAGALAPAQEPSFTTSNFSTGSPRWVMEFANGDGMMNNQASGTVAGKPGDAMWQVNTGGGWSSTLYTYAKALAVVDSNGQVVVKQAFIVADGDQAAGTHDTLTAVQYNGQSPVAPPAPAKIAVRYVCGGWNATHWAVFNSGGTAAQGGFYVHIQRTNTWRWVEHVTRGAGKWGAVWTHAGNEAQVRYDGTVSNLATVSKRAAC